MKWEFWMGPEGAATFLISNDAEREYCKKDGQKLITTFEATVDEAFKKHDELFNSETNKRKKNVKTKK